MFSMCFPMPSIFSSIIFSYLLYSETSLETEVIIISIVQNGVPLLFMVTMNCLTVFELRSAARVALVGNSRSSALSRYKQNKRTMRMLVMLIVVYICCITPEKTFYLLYVYKIIPRIAVESPGSFGSVMYTVLVMLFMANSCVNPLIYAKLHRSFRRQTLHIFCSCVSKQHTKHTWNSLLSLVSASVITSGRRLHDGITSFRERRSSSFTTTVGDSRRSTTTVGDTRRNTSESMLSNRETDWRMQTSFEMEENNEVFIKDCSAVQHCLSVLIEDMNIMAGGASYIDEENMKNSIL